MTATVTFKEVKYLCKEKKIQLQKYRWPIRIILNSHLESKSPSEEHGCCLEPQKYVRKLLVPAPSASREEQNKL